LTRENALSRDELEQRGVTPESVAEDLGGVKQGWICEADDRILGFTMGYGESGEILVLAVLTEAEGRGVGRKLMSLVQNWLFSLGHQELWLMENPDPDIRAYRFYRKLGWQATGQFKNGEQMLKLTRSAGSAVR
jgi:ribosomal protein S18 acetylase RimI-like enzyme